MRFQAGLVISLSHTDEGAFFQDAFHIKTVKQPPQIMRLYRDLSILCIGKIRDPKKDLVSKKRQRSLRSLLRLRQTGI